MSAPQPSAVPLSPLRQELNLAASTPGVDGAPSWTLYDPAAHRFFQLGWPAFEILSRWSLGTAQAIAAAVRRDTTLQIEPDDVLSVERFLLAHQLTAAVGHGGTQRLLQAQAQQRLSPAMWLLKHYLFIRMPLLRPMPLLRRLAPLLGWLYRPAFWWLTLGAAVTGLYLASRHWDEFVHTFHAYADWHGLFAIAVALSFAKVLHEFGHAVTAYRHGCHVPTMGVALLVMWPVLYTDTNEAWKLRSRRDRMRIGAAGMLAELALAAWATLLWNFLPDGPLRAGVFLLATSTWLVTLSLNASPFTRFDGYFLLSDWLNVPNLHERAFALTRWWLRERLFALGESPPEQFPASKQRFLIVFSVTAWLYRLVLFFSIALLVFHAFFRALGLFLMAVEIGWFIVLPVLRELGVWWQRRGALRWNRHSLRTAAVATAALLLVLLPWQHSVSAPAVLMRDKAQGVYAAHAAMIAHVDLRDGQHVSAGQVLAQLTSPELDDQLRETAIREDMLRWEVQQQPFNDELRQLGPALRKRWETQREALDGLHAQIAQLTLRAPFDGRIADVDPELRDGVWLPAGARLFTVIGDAGRDGGVRGEAYVGESALARIRDGAAAEFISDLPEQGARSCRVSGIDRVNLATLDTLYPASVYGGAIPSRKKTDGEVLPLDTRFRVRFDHCAGGDALNREMPGRALVRGRAESIAGHAVRWLAAVARREATP